MVGVVRIRADGPLNSRVHAIDVLIVLCLDDRSYREQSHVGSMKDRLGLRVWDVFPSRFQMAGREGSFLHDAKPRVPERAGVARR